MPQFPTTGFPVLVVEDGDTLRPLVRSLLAANVGVEIAQTGLEALECHDQPFALAVVDADREANPTASRLATGCVASTGSG